MDLLTILLLIIIAVLLFFLLKKERVLGINEDNKKTDDNVKIIENKDYSCLLYTSPSPRDRTRSRMPSSA